MAVGIVCFDVVYCDWDQINLAAILDPIMTKFIHHLLNIFCPHHLTTIVNFVLE